MKYVAKSTANRGNVNVSVKNPFRDFLWLATTVIGIFAVVYIGLGFAADLVIQSYEEEITGALSVITAKAIIDQDKKLGASLQKKQQKLREILNKLVQNLPQQNQGQYQLVLQEDKTVNALALPGNTIVVYRGLIDLIESENEMAMVLAHELGHFAHKDHLRGLGRGIVFFAMSAILLGEGSNMTELVGGSLNALQMKFSRDQESAADSFGLDLLNATYGHVGGAEDFFAKLEREEHGSIFLLFAASHPISKTRVKQIKKWGKQKNYSRQPTVAF